MKTVSACVGILLPTLLLLPSCQKREELTSEAVRELTVLDARAVPLAPTSADRFESPETEAPAAGGAHTHEGEGLSGGFTYTAGAGWTEKAPTQFRTINFALPEGGELYLTLAGGGVLPNINRWFGQFGADKITGDQLGQLARVQILGADGYLAEATGTYSGMGRAEQDNMALLGALAQVDGQLITVKMISTADEVQAQRAAFISFCESLVSK